MAIIKFGMMMTDARGKLGGQVFTKTRSGATVRTKVTPTNPQTAAQQTARAILGNLSTAWRALTEEQRQGWNAAVDGFLKTNIFGDTYSPSGKNLFVGLNANLAQTGSPRNDVSPTPIEVPAAIILSVGVEIGTAEIVIDFQDAAPGGNFYMIFQASKPMSAGRFNFSGSYSTFKTVPGTSFPSPASLYTSYVDKFGALPVDSKIAFRVFVISKVTGQKSVESVGTAIVVN